jgi:hypothetical protein
MLEYIRDSAEPVVLEVLYGDELALVVDERAA